MFPCIGHLFVLSLVGQRLHDFIVYVGDQMPSVDDPAMSKYPGYQACHRYVGAMADSAEEVLQCEHPIYGHVVSVVIPGYMKTLTMCELQVFGKSQTL